MSNTATERNDPIDEWHALYSPYVRVAVLDRRTVGRCRSAKLPHVDRITRKLAEVPELLGL